MVAYRLEYNRPPSSCEGEPAPRRMLPADAIPLVEAGFPNGDRTEVPVGASMGDVFAVEEPESGWEAENCGR